MIVTVGAGEAEALAVPDVVSVGVGVGESVPAPVGVGDGAGKVCGHVTGEPKLPASDGRANEGECEECPNEEEEKNLSIPHHKRRLNCSDCDMI